ncbi:3D domain-containing protein [Solidesulfovibrio sp.]|uniref:3D domain-containing protein n=1 Tax=Solidesulfovibrio sp. TaxID=2910990 RepID=UPI00263672EB|nr:3D domain-containing protein [Solidesulfovibrio sp.]
MDEQLQKSPAAPSRADLARSASLALLALSAIGLSVAGEAFHERAAGLRHQNALAVQEAVMAQASRQDAATLFSLDEDNRRRFTLTTTAYCPLCGSEDGQPQPTARGGVVRAGRTVAVSQDLRRLLGRKVFIEGLGVRVVEDLMHPRFTDRLDLCLADRDQALAFGVQRLQMVVLD